jgi:hypothetical protein
MGKSSAIVVLVAFATVSITACGGSESSAPPPPPPPPPRTIEAPIDVQSLPYYDSSWTFTDDGGTIEIQTDIYRDDEGEEFGMAVCNLTRFSGHEDKDVMVLGSDGGPLAHRFEESFTSSGTCEKG